MPELQLLYVTFGSLDEAKRLSRMLVEERLVACANILPSMTSVYEWQGKVCEETECVVIMKTRRDLVDRVTARIVEEHSYECPCVVALPIGGGHSGFLDWVAQQTGAS